MAPEPSPYAKVYPMRNHWMEQTLMTRREGRKEVRPLRFQE